MQVIIVSEYVYLCYSSSDQRSRQVQASNDASRLYHKLFSLYVQLFIFHIISLHPVYHHSTVYHEFLSLPFCLLRLLWHKQKGNVTVYSNDDIIDHDTSMLTVNDMHNVGLCFVRQGQQQYCY